MPGKSCAEVLKTDIYPKCMGNRVAKNRVATQQVHLEGKLLVWGEVAPTENQEISSGNPACKNIIRKGSHLFTLKSQ